MTVFTNYAVAEEAQRRIDDGEDPSRLVHPLTDPDGDIWDISSSISIAEYQKGGYISTYFTLQEVASGCLAIRHVNDD